MMRVAVVITARASYPRVRTVLEELKGTVELHVLLAASATVPMYGEVDTDLIRDNLYDGTHLVPVLRDHPSSLVVRHVPSLVTGFGGLTATLTAALTVDGVGREIHRIGPSVVVTIADRYETLATAYAAVTQNLHLVHLLGGEVSGNVDDRIRNAVTALADTHCCATAEATRRVVGTGALNALQTGCPSIDVAKHSTGYPELTEGTGAEIDLRAPYVMVLQHPETESPLSSAAQMTCTLDAAWSTGWPMVVFWPNADWGGDHSSKSIREWREEHPRAMVRYVRHTTPMNFYRLLREAKCLVGNSSVGIRECAYLGTPVINLGQRQRGRERAENVLDSGWEQEQIAQAIIEAPAPYPSSDLYGDGTAGEKIAEAIRALA